MPNKKPKKKSKKPIATIGARFDEAVREASSVQEMLQNITAAALAVAADARVVEVLPVEIRKNAARDLAAIAVKLTFHDRQNPRVSKREAIAALDAIDVLAQGMQKLSADAIHLSAEAREAIVQAALEGMLHMMGVTVRRRRP